MLDQSSRYPLRPDNHLPRIAALEKRDKFAHMYRHGGWLWGVIILALGCASKANITGGPRDETPPKVIADESTANFQTNFAEERIELTMDEWVKLEDPLNQVLISPPLEKRPDIRLRKKSVLLSFNEEEVLRENATYSINFGEAIQDITESNPLKNYSFVFATGDIIDSLMIKGKTLDAFTGDPVENATILVYESLEDSIVFREKPFYASRSDADGSFRIGNVKEGTFKILAVMDENLNYQYEQAAEQMGFLPEPFVVTIDTSKQITLLMSQELAELYLEDDDTTGWNQATFTYNREPLDIQATYDDPDGTLYFDRRNNDVLAWNAVGTRTQWQIYLEDTTTGVIDTFGLRADGRQADVQPMQRQNRLKNTGHPADPFFICFDRPLDTFDLTYITLVEGDSGQTVNPGISIIDTVPFCLALTYRWQPTLNYTLTALPGAITDIFGLTNDTIDMPVPVGAADRFGNIILKVEGLSPDNQYLLEFLENDNVIFTLYVRNQTEYNKTLEKLKPATYRLRVTEDSNGNGRWDPANYLKGIQPERIATHEVEPLRANWDVELNYKWNQ